MSDDDSDDVVDLGRREKRAAEVHPIHAEIQDLLDQIVDRAEIYEKAGRRDEAERLLAGLKHARDILEERVGEESDERVNEEACT